MQKHFNLPLLTFFNIPILSVEPWNQVALDCYARLQQPLLFIFCFRLFMHIWNLDNKFQSFVREELSAFHFLISDHALGDFVSLFLA